MAKNGNGLHPAPVLPAMGLHSFHNDSPPFAAASEYPHDPEHLSLDAVASSSRSSTSPLGHLEPASSISGVLSGSGSKSPAMPIPTKGFDTPSIAHRGSGSAGGHHRIPTDPSDEALSTSRSRRLVSGYIFGNPPSPVRGQHASVNGLLEADEDVRRHPTPPLSELQGRDSPPLSEFTAPSSPSDPSDAMGKMTIAPDQPPDTAVPEVVPGQQPGSSLRRNDATYDALTGLNDGEADLDESAPQAAFTTTEYLQGDDGEAGKYRFPRHRLRKTMKDETKIPLVIVACGSFSPPTYLHLRMFEMAKDEIVESQTFEIMGGYYSPVSSKYKKAGLAAAIDRVRMCELAVEHTSTWLMVDPWEAGQPEYQRTAVVLEHFDHELNVKGGGLTMSDGKKRKYKVMLLAGGDLIESFGEPGVWSEPDLHIILGRFGCLIVERAGSDVWAFLLSHDILYSHRRNVIVIKQLIYNDISSTKVRLFVRRGMSIKYLLPNSVIQYIYDNKLYRGSDHKAITS